MLTVSVAVGNLDLHMKNFSLLHLTDQRVQVAPMYDVVPQHFYDASDGEMALKVGGEFEHRLLTRNHLESAGVELGVRNPEEIVKGVLKTIRDVAAVEKPHAASHPGLQFMISAMAANLLDGKTVSGEVPGSAASASPTTRGSGGWRWDDPRWPQDLPGAE